MDSILQKPTILMMLTCCLWPGVMFALGVFVGKFRPRFRMPFTVDRDDHEIDL